MRICRLCGEEKPLDDFYQQRSTGDRHKFVCKPCDLDAMRWDHLRRKYSITRVDYERLFADQDGRCAGCGSPPVGGRSGGRFFDVDHDHATGTVRGLLCNACNQALGNVADDPARLRALASYVERYRT